MYFTSVLVISYFGILVADTNHYSYDSKTCIHMRDTSMNKNYLLIQVDTTLFFLPFRSTTVQVALNTGKLSS